MTGPTEELRRNLFEYLEDAYNWGRLEETNSRRTGLSWAEYRDQMLEEMVERMTRDDGGSLPPHVDGEVIREYDGYYEVRSPDGKKLYCWSCVEEKLL